MDARLFYHIALFLVHSVVGNMVTSIPGYYTWAYGDRDKLFCPNACKADDEPDRCCSCEAKPCWELNAKLCPLGNLHVEYIDIFGSGVIVGGNNESFVEFIHTKGILTEIPANICNWKRQLVTFDLRHNRLASVSRVKCLTKLDTLRLDYNLIKYIDNTTFTEMKNLRLLSVSHNLIKKLDPNVVNIKDGNIPQIDFSNNHYMDYLDLTNVIRPGPFCMVNFTNSSVEHLTNELGFIMDKVMHGPGDILLEHIHVGSFINFTSLGIKELKDFSKYFSGQISIDASSIDCDCMLYPVLESLGPDISKFWHDIDGQSFECHSPENMKGKNLTEMISSGNFGDLTCDISEKPECPHYLCHCIDTPSQHKVLVNCTGVGFTSMPDVMPVGAWNNYKIDLILADNNITEVPERNYYSRLVNLDLRNNDIRAITKGAAANISCTLNIQNQTLEKLTPILQHNDPKLITFGQHPVVCDCSNTWVGDWIRLKDGQGRLNCLIDSQIIPAENVTQENLHCKTYTPLPSVAMISSAVGCIITLLAISTLSYVYRYEILICKRLLFKREIIPDIKTIDVFLSFYENNEDVFHMVNKHIKPALLEAGYTVFIPWLDIPYGAQYYDELATGIDRAVNYVIILCEDYAADYQTVSGLETIWNSFMADQAKRIVLINFDNLKARSIRDERLKAMRRTVCLDFKTRSSGLITRLKEKLGKPLTPKKNDSPINESLKPNSTDVGETCEAGDITIEPCELTGNSSGIAAGTFHKGSVFDRLARQRDSECNCKYRRCYLHDESFVRRQRNATSACTIK